MIVLLLALQAVDTDPTATSTPTPTPTATATATPTPTPTPTPIPTPSPTSDDYVGRAAPASSAGTTSFGEGHLRAGLEVFAQYAYRSTYGAQSTWFHEFDLPRAHGAIDGTYESVHARVLMEAVRSTPQGALYGVDGDSFVLRAREAYAEVTPHDLISVRGGIVPTLTIPELDGTWMMRAISPSMVESSGLTSPADLGAQAISTLPKGYGWVGLGAYNGEGYHQAELNRGKNLEIATSLHPLPGSETLRPLALHLGYTAGSSGAEKARADRFECALLWQGKMVRGGAAFTYAWGENQDSSLRALVMDGFVRIEPVDRFFAGARASFFQRNLDARDSIFTGHVAFGYRIAKPMEVYLAGSRTLPTQIVRDANPGSDFLELRAVTRIVF
jgi:hypothetical protein